MRIAIIGAGAVGGTLAALLARARHDVTVIARGENLRAIRQEGLRLDGGFGEVNAPLGSTGRLTESPELAILATKAQDAEAAQRGDATLGHLVAQQQHEQRPQGAGAGGLVHRRRGVVEDRAGRGAHRSPTR